MTPTEQILEWQKGNSIHNTERDECCPDFSCCRPELLADQMIRNKFVVASLSDDTATVNSMLFDFLGKAISTYEPKKKVYLTDGSRNTVI